MPTTSSVGPTIERTQGQLTRPGPDIDQPSGAGGDRGLEPIEELGHGRRQDRRPPPGVALGDPIVSLDLVDVRHRAHGAMRPGGTGVSPRWRADRPAASAGRPAG